MFLEGLPERAREGFAALAHELVHADGRLSDEEGAIMARLRVEAGAFAEQGIRMSFDEAVASIVEPTQRRAAFLECIGICWSDGTIADEEAVLLDRIADAWSITSPERVAIIEWVKRQAQLVSEAQALILGGR